jgi:hypothetical protein
MYSDISIYVSKETLLAPSELFLTKLDISVLVSIKRHISARPALFVKKERQDTAALEVILIATLVSSFGELPLEAFAQGVGERREQ